MCSVVQDTPDNHRLTLRKSAKLRHRSLVQSLFETGKSVYAGHIRMTYRTLSDRQLADSFKGEVPDRVGPLQVMVTVPKKKRRHAVDRVLMRRRIREAFRIMSPQIREAVRLNPEIRTLSIAIIYLHNENDDYAAVADAVATALKKMQRRIGLLPPDGRNCEKP